jgi:hypothetical protein
MDRASKAALLKILTSSGGGGGVRTIKLPDAYSIVSSPAGHFGLQKTRCII